MQQNREESRIKMLERQNTQAFYKMLKTSKTDLRSWAKSEKAGSSTIQMQKRLSCRKGLTGNSH